MLAGLPQSSLRLLLTRLDSAGAERHTIPHLHAWALHISTMTIGRLLQDGHAHLKPPESVFITMCAQSTSMYHGCMTPIRQHVVT